jgi:hypothetical protein
VRSEKRRQRQGRYKEKKGNKAMKKAMKIAMKIVEKIRKEKSRLRDQNKISK